MDDANYRVVVLFIYVFLGKYQSTSSNMPRSFAKRGLKVGVGLYVESNILRTFLKLEMI